MERAESDPVLALAFARAVLVATQGFGPGARGASDLTREEIREIAAGRAISAIKLVRSRTGLGLRESKDIVDSFRDETGIRPLSPAPTPF
jgi:ribosomal protein L7/L12